MWLVCAIASAQQPPECPFGVNAHQAADEALDRAAQAGIGWVRFDFNWFQFEPAPDTYDWSVPDRFVDAAAARGLQVYVTIGYTPTWAATVPCDDGSPNPDDHCLTRPPDPAQWEEFVRLSVQRYGGRVKAWGIWNEPNLSQFWSGTREEWVAGILRPAAAVVHAECADCLVVGPELANLREPHWDADNGVCLFGECSFNGWDYSLRAILTDAGDVLDVVSHHKYEDPAEAWWREAIAGESILTVQVLHGIQEITDDLAPGKPVWITEFGWENPPAGSHTPQYSADQLTALFSAYPDVRRGLYPASTSPWPELQKLFWYDLHDDPSGPAWGLLTADLQPKPAYDAYAAVIGDLGGCAAFVDFEEGVGHTGTPTGSTSPPSETGGPRDSAPPAPTGDATGQRGGEKGGCGCGAGPAAPAAVLPLALLALRRRER